MLLVNQGFRFSKLLIPIFVNFSFHFGPRMAGAKLDVGSRWFKKTLKLTKMAQDGAREVQNDKNPHFEKKLKNNRCSKVFGTRGCLKSVKMVPKMAQDKT